MADFIGQELGRYHILEQLGEGGMAVVYKAYDTRLEADVAVKVIRTENLTLGTMDRALKRFEREAKALAKLTHPNIVKVTDYGEHEGKPYLIMEYLSGGTLKERLGKPMPWQEAVRLLLPVAKALSYAHQHGFVHRDVKPSNILITDSGEPMLTDFGIAKILETEDGQTLTGTGMGVGTPEYMAPEQGMAREVDARSDVYALGIVLYELISGRKPYVADTPMAVIFKHMTDPLPRPRSFVPGLPQDVENILLKALAKKPEDRYEDMSRFAEALERLFSKNPKAAPESKKRAHQAQELRRLPEDSRDTIDAVQAAAIEHVSQYKNAEIQKEDNTRRWSLYVFIALALIGLLVITQLVMFIRSLIAGASPAAVVTQPLLSMGTLTAPMLEIGSTWIRPEDGMTMVYVPAGPFLMGSNKYGNENERPEHTVTLDAFWIDRTEVTNEMYAKCVKEERCQKPADKNTISNYPSHMNPESLKLPVTFVDWNDAKTYCSWAGSRLPTEAEWEKAARSGDERIYPWGWDISCQKANYWGSAEGCEGDITEVGSYPKNVSPYGALDMAGNVWEWVSDWYDDSYYSSSPSTNPSGRATGEYRVLRGGSWSDYGVYVRTSYRGWDLPSEENNRRGFRCARGASQ